MSNAKPDRRSSAVVQRDEAIRREKAVLRAVEQFLQEIDAAMERLREAVLKASGE